MKKEYEQHEKHETTENNNRQDEIRNHLLMMKQNVSKINTTEPSFPDYTKKTNNVNNTPSIKIVVENSSNDTSINSLSETINKEKKSSESKNDSKEDSKNNSQNKSMYSKKSYKRGNGITIKTN